MGWQRGGTRKEVGITNAGNRSGLQKSEIEGIISGNSKLWVITDLGVQSIIIKPAKVCLGANFSLEHHSDMLPHSQEGYSSDAASLKDQH